MTELIALESETTTLETDTNFNRKTKRLNVLTFQRYLQYLRQYLAGQIDLVMLDNLLTLNFDLSLKDALNTLVNPFGHTALQQALLTKQQHEAQQLKALGADEGSIETAIYSFMRKHESGHSLHIMKEFGLTLGIEATSVDGTYSQYAHIAPTYALMAKAIDDYSKKEVSFNDIRDAYEFTQSRAEYRLSTPTNPHVANELVSRIQEGKITSIPTGCVGHVMGMTLVPDAVNGGAYLVYTNRGEGATEETAGTHIYRINNLKNITPQFVSTMLNGLDKDTPHSEIMRKIKAVTDNQEPIYSLSQAIQKRDNCTIANPRANLEGVLLCQRANERQIPVEALSHEEAQSVHQHYKTFTHHMRSTKINELAEKIMHSPNNRDLTKLATSYIEQHTNEKDKLHVAKLQAALELRSTPVYKLHAFENFKQNDRTPYPRPCRLELDATKPEAGTRTRLTMSTN